MSHPKGVFKIILKELSFSKDSQLYHKDYPFKVKLELGAQISYIRGEGNDTDLNEVLLFSQLPQEKLLVSVESEATSEKKGYAEVLLTPLAKIPQTKHEVSVHCIYRDKNLAIEDKESAVLVFEIIFTEHYKGFLQITVVEAVLLRNTEAIGHMDPYTVLELGDKKVRTKVLEQAGRKPKWNQNFELEVNSPSQQLKVAVLDQDVTKDDLVGTAVINLREEDYLRQGEPVAKTVQLTYQHENAGTLSLVVRFCQK